MKLLYDSNSVVTVIVRNPYLLVYSFQNLAVLQFRSVAFPFVRHLGAHQRFERRR